MVLTVTPGIGCIVWWCRYWLVVYANVEATYRVTAERETTPGQPLFASTFMEELWDWVSNTNIGFVTALVAGTIVLCLCIGCCWQVHQSGGVKGTAKQLRRNFSEVGASRPRVAACVVSCATPPTAVDVNV